MKRIAILGSTGSIGKNTLEIIKRFPDKFCLVGLTANSDSTTLLEQINRFTPKLAAMANAKEFLRLKSSKNKTKLYFGQEAISEIASSKEIDTVVLAISGSAALFPLLSAVRKGKTVLLANKEALVMAGGIITKEAKKHGAKIIPIDSEQSAIWQCLAGEDKKRIKRIYLTASGGPLYDLKKSDFKNISLKKVLKHPRWNMGKKITVDSATLMNKGLEIIEAMWFFDVDASIIDVVIHREAVIHSMVEFIDAVIMAQLSIPDMRIPIQYALSYPERWGASVGCLDLSKMKYFTFEKPDFNKFPCLSLAYDAAKRGGTLPCVLNASNEEAVSAFLDLRIKFIDIPRIIDKILSKHKPSRNPGLTEILEADNWARHKAREIIFRG